MPFSRSRGGQGDGSGQVLRHGQDQHIRRSGGQVRIQHTLFSQHIEQPGQADGDARAGKLAVRVISARLSYRPPEQTEPISG